MNRCCKVLIAVFGMLCVAVTLQAQYKVAITIDDMPKPKHFGGGAFATELIDVLDSLQIPVAIFINEGNIYKGNGEVEGRLLLERWIGAPYTTVGNHSYSHYACSDVPADSFLADVKKGEAITRPLAARYHKELNYFRFPYNNLGKDSAHQSLIAKGMEAMGYTLVPFTVESEDWMYNYVYEYYLDRKLPDSAQLIADRYIAKTLWAFEHYEGLSQLLYREPMQHIYLCHDNVLNAYCMPLRCWRH